MMKNFENIYITGDTHGRFMDLITKTIRYGLTERDLLIILGDVGINFYGNFYDMKSKDRLATIPSTVLCIRGNHEMRPDDAALEGIYHEIDWMGDRAYVEDKYPRFIMAKDGARYLINGREFLVIGGAYSVDKFWRLQKGYQWFPNEQLTKAEMEAIRKKVAEHGNREDVILAHTCPYNNRPTECFLQGVDEGTVDTSMEHFLQDVVDTTDYNDYYCGHWHIEKQDGKIRFLFHDVLLLGESDTQG